MMSGKINWYDNDSCRGSIIGDDGNWYRIHEFTLHKDNIILEAGLRIKFELSTSSIHPIVTFIERE